MKHTFLAIALLTIALISCKSVKDATENTDPGSFETIVSNSLMGTGSEGIEESIIVCNSELDLYNIKQKMNSVNYATEELDAMEIDFDKETLIGYFQPVRSTGGYDLKAESITKVDGEDSYFVHYTLKTPQGAAITVLTQPFIFIKTSKLEGTVNYKVTEAGGL